MMFGLLSFSPVEAEFNCHDLFEDSSATSLAYFGITSRPANSVTVPHPHFEVVEKTISNGTVFGTLFLIRYVERPSTYELRGREEEIDILQYVVRDNFLRIVSRRSHPEAYSSSLSMIDELLSMYPQIQKISFNLGETNSGRTMDMSLEQMQEIVNHPSQAHSIHPMYSSMWMRGFKVERASLFEVGEKFSLLTVLVRREPDL